jgi:hypothetical protein
MKKHFFKRASLALALVLASVLSVTALAQNGGSAHPVEGTYNVNSTSAEMGTLTFVLVLKKNGDKWMGEIKDAPMPLTVNNAMVDPENNVSVTADAGGTPVEIKGKFEAGKIKGGWTAGDMKGTWEATKKELAAAAPATTAPTAGAATASSLADLEGTYDTVVSADGQGELPLTLVIKNDAGKLKTEVSNGGELNIVDIKVDGDTVTLTATYSGNGPIMLPGKRTGDQMGGKWEFGGFAGTWKATKKK